MTRSIVGGLLLTLTGCTGAIAPVNKGGALLSEGDQNVAVAGDADGNATKPQDSGDDSSAGGEDGAVADGAGGNDDGGAEQPPAAVGTIVSKAGSLVTKGFDPKSAYAETMDLSGFKSFSVTITEAPRDVNFYRLIKEYECTPCPDNDCDGDGTIPEYETVTVMLKDPFVIPGQPPPADVIDDTTMLPVSADYVHNTTTDQAVTISYLNGKNPPTMLTGGDAGNVKVVHFDTLPTAADKKLKVTLKAKFFDQMANPTQQNFAPTTEDVDITVETEVYAMPTQPAPPTCGANEYPKPVYEE